jgi:hypothetical protein
VLGDVGCIVPSKVGEVGTDEVGDSVVGESLGCNVSGVGGVGGGTGTSVVGDVGEIVGFSVTGDSEFGAIVGSSVGISVVG